MNLPRILATDSSQKNEVTFVIEVPTRLDAFNGHFPDNPILPGVVQIDWAVRFAAAHFGLGEINARDFQVKFRSIIRPNAPLSLTLQFDPAKNQISFTYKSGDEMMSSGQLKLGVQA